MIATNEWFWNIMCLCYFVGGCTIGWWFSEWRRKRPKKTGVGRWDWSNRSFKRDDDG